MASPTPSRCTPLQRKVTTFYCLLVEVKGKNLPSINFVCGNRFHRNYSLPFLSRFSLAPSSPKTSSPRRRGLDKCLATTCVTSVAELTELVLQAQQRFAEAYQSKDNKLISQVHWASNVLQTLYYFMKCSHQIDEDISDILAATRR